MLTICSLLQVLFLLLSCSCLLDVQYCWFINWSVLICLALHIQDKQLQSAQQKKVGSRVLSEHIKKEKEAAKQGKRPYYLKKCLLAHTLTYYFISWLWLSMNMKAFLFLHCCKHLQFHLMVFHVLVAAEIRHGELVKKYEGLKVWTSPKKHESVLAI